MPWDINLKDASASLSLSSRLIPCRLPSQQGFQGRFQQLRLSYRVVQKNRAFFERLAHTYQKHDMGRSGYKKLIRMEHEEKAYSNVTAWSRCTQNAYLYLLP